MDNEDKAENLFKDIIDIVELVIQEDLDNTPKGHLSPFIIDVNRKVGGDILNI